MTNHAYIYVKSSLSEFRSSYEIPQLIPSRITLEKRLSKLPIEEQRLVYHLERVYFHKAVGADFTPALNLDLASSFKTLTNKSLIDFLITLWTIDYLFLAKSLKYYSVPEPQSYLEKIHWFFDQQNALKKTILKHWQEENFGLGNRFSWLAKIKALLENDEILEAEKLRLLLKWNLCYRCENRHQFNLFSIIIYVFQWNIVSSWQEYTKADVQKHLANISVTEELAEELIGSSD